MGEYDPSYTHSITPDTITPGIALLWRAVNPPKTVLRLFNASPTALLTRDFGVGSFHSVSQAFGLRGTTDSKRDLYLISKCEVWHDDNISLTSCQHLHREIKKPPRLGEAFEPAYLYFFRGIPVSVHGG